VDDADSDHSTVERFLPLVEAVCRDRVQITISDRDFCRCEQAAGVGSPNAQLREGIREAVFLCTASAIAPPLRLQRRGLERNAMRELETHATEALYSLTGLHSAMDQLKSFAPGYSEHIEELGAADVIAALPQFYRHLQNIMIACQKYSRAQEPVKGGRPRWRYFETLIKALQKPFEAVTGEKATANADKAKPSETKYHGPFVMFVEAVLPLARTAMPAGWPLETPADNFRRGRKIESTLREIRHSAPPPRK
jgi:hypothetical protein